MRYYVLHSSLTMNGGTSYLYRNDDSESKRVERENKKEDRAGDMQRIRLWKRRKGWSIETENETFYNIIGKM